MRRADEFPDLDAPAVVDLIARSRLHPEDAEIARLRFIDRLPHADIAAAVHLDRSSVGYRLRARIIPQMKKYAGPR